MIKKILFLIVISISTQVTATPGNWMPVAKNISGIIIEGGENSGVATILIEGGVQAEYIPSDCNTPYNTADLTTEKGRGILSVALSARLSNMPVKLALSCIGGRPLITHIWL
ncbi:MAG: hypothetical protein OQK78_03780 [Gammaproteobacteria bacterium]|nr:hypothetical protein [Gammaproteobacteria bacterium]